MNEEEMDEIMRNEMNKVSVKKLLIFTNRKLNLAQLNFNQNKQFNKLPYIYSKKIHLTSLNLVLSFKNKFNPIKFNPQKLNFIPKMLNQFF